MNLRELREVCQRLPGERIFREGVTGVTRCPTRDPTRVPGRTPFVSLLFSDFEEAVRPHTAFVTDTTVADVVRMSGMVRELVLPVWTRAVADYYQPGEGTGHFKTQRYIAITLGLPYFGWLG